MKDHSILQYPYYPPFPFSGVARLGHTGAHALATRGCAPPVQVCIGADSIVVDRESGAKRSSNQTAQYRYVYPQNYESHSARVCRITK